MSARRFLPIGLALAALVLAGPVAAAAPVSVTVNMARILRIGSPAATVIIGNPGIADVTIQDPQTLVLTGKSFGQTNMIVLDAVGNPIADTLVEVVAAEGDVVTVYQGLARQTLACSPACQPTIMLGDDPNFTQQTLQSGTLLQQSASQ